MVLVAQKFLLWSKEPDDFISMSSDPCGCGIRSHETLAAKPGAQHLKFDHLSIQILFFLFANIVKQDLEKRQ